MNMDDRFEVMYQQGDFFSTWYEVIKDRETGVHYLKWQKGEVGGMTPLLDDEGKPVIEK